VILFIPQRQMHLFDVSMSTDGKTRGKELRRKKDSRG
jgi:hypothetical protein